MNALDPKKVSILASALFHAGLFLAILLGANPSQTIPRAVPRSIDLVSVEDLLPDPPPPVAVEPPEPEVAPLVAQPAVPPSAEDSSPAASLATAPAPDAAEAPDPAAADAGGMALPTRIAAVSALPGPARAGGAPGGSSSEPDYLPQFRITGIPVVPSKAVLANIEYPPLAAKQGIEATVYLELFIDEAGRIRKVALLKDPGFGFAEAAIAALKDVPCSPATMDGKPVAVRFRYPVRFALK